MALLEEVGANFGRLKLYVGGRWVDSASTTTQTAFNPAKGEAIGQVPFSLKDEVDQAVTSAEAAFHGWKDVPIVERVQCLFRMKYAFEAHLEDLSRINTQNHGKTIEESRGDMRRVIGNIEAAIAAAHTLAKGERMDQVADGIDEGTVKEPLGVFAVVCPFNFPLMIPFWFIPYALAVGCTLVVKPSEITPIPLEWAMKIIEKEVKLPAGAINLVHGGREVVENLIAHPSIKGVTFVGSTEGARNVYRLAGQHGKRALANGGAKNSIVVMPSARLDSSVPSITSSFFGNAGQRCLAGANLLAVGDIHEKLVQKFVEAARRFKLGYGLDPAVDMGPVVSEKAKARILQHVSRGIDEGAKLILDGTSALVKMYPEGYYVGSTIFDDVTADMSVAKSEIFGPVASVMHTDSLDDAIETINKGTEYGNAASVFTTIGRDAREFRRRVLAGNVGVNIGVAAPLAFFPFGGMRNSFYGTLHAQIETIDFFTDRKVIIEKW
jgi:malonate-semialdehyde dehydrogenase (acetylating)/methylmalonate-semialdehyde dehydrogenase